MADDDLISYDFGKLMAAADHCKAAAGSITGTLGDVESTCKNLLGTWTGSAQGAYLQRQTEWNQAGNDLKELLTAIENALREAALRMQASEKTNTHRFGG